MQINILLISILFVVKNAAKHLRGNLIISGISDQIFKLLTFSGQIVTPVCFFSVE